MKNSDVMVEQNRWRNVQCHTEPAELSQACMNFIQCCCQYSGCTYSIGIYLCLWRILNKETQYDPCKSRQVPVHFHNTGICYSSPQLQPPFSACLPFFSAGMLPGKIQRRWRASLFDWLAGVRWAGPNGPYISIVAASAAALGSWWERESKVRG